MLLADDFSIDQLAGLVIEGYAVMPRRRVEHQRSRKESVDADHRGGAAGCQVIRAEKRSGTTTEGREALRTVLEFLHAGDVLMVTRIDRLARSISDLQDIVRTVRARGAVLKATEQPIDTGTAAGKCFLDMLGVFAEFETNLRRERQLEGIAKAKAAGVYKGRPPSIEAARVREMKAQGMRPVDVAKALKIGRASVYRVLGQGGG
jgi:DNA invertase Pin-like site-specific DNA recombinase